MEPSFDFEYAHPEKLQILNDIIICSLCLQPFVDPLKYCHTFCGRCITEHIVKCKNNDRVAQCPLCCKELTTFQEPDYTIKNILANLEVFCIKKSCDWKGPRCNIEEHLSRFCEHFFCPNEGCTWKGTKPSIVEHREVCDFTILPCEHASKVY